MARRRLAFASFSVSSVSSCSEMLAAIRTWWARRSRPKSLGERGELAAVRYLKRKGYHIVGRQIDLGVGELDIVAVDGRTVVFVEVKTRRSDAAGTPAEAVDELRQQRMTRAALTYLKSHGLLNCAARFDLVAILWPEDARRPTIEHIQDAFSAVGTGQFFS
jgi:putative endonuclease